MENTIPCPPEREYLWRWFSELRSLRGWDWNGLEHQRARHLPRENKYRMQGLTFGEIDAWARLTRRVLTLPETALIIRLDDSLRRIIERREPPMVEATNDNVKNVFRSMIAAQNKAP